MTVEAMQRFFAQNGINLATLLEQVRAQIAWVKVVNRQIVPRVTVTVDQLEMAVEEARRNEGEPEYLLSEIVLPVDNPAQAQTVAQDAARLVQTLREGASFESLAAQVSAAASAERGGDVGWVAQQRDPAELRNTLEGMREGEISDPIPSPVGYYIFWLRDTAPERDGGGSSIAGIEVELAQILLPVDGQTTSMPCACGQAAGAARRSRRLRSDGRRRRRAGRAGLGPARLAAARRPAPELRQAVSSLPVSQVSAPCKGRPGIHLLMVCDRREPQAAMPQREQIAERLQRERVERLARRYLRDLRKEAFVEVRL